MSEYESTLAQSEVNQETPASVQAEIKQPSTERPKRDPAGLTSEYHKAHKQLMLWSAILFTYELIGVDLSSEKAEKIGGNVGATIQLLKSPQAIPWALLILVLYFAFKCSIEWRQCHLGRRQIVDAKIDFFSGICVAALALALYVFQTLGRIQFADKLSQFGRSTWIPSLTLLLLGVVIPTTLSRFTERKMNTSQIIMEGGTLLIVFALLVYSVFAEGSVGTIASLTSLFGAIILFAICLVRILGPQITRSNSNEE